ncbi:hypothetical protein [Pseudoalteromonas sp. M8]|uniref:hypothetical protein n=1 Tax=Pseudoalteromonas sp. M8 TaxID=2692624 RepID=UPI002010F353|nr:hypothetical protein [Pseudoalteromonas sp. M8]
MKTLNKIRNAIPLIAVSSLLAACGGGSDDPKVEEVPVTPAVTTAEVSGSVIKGALSQARISVTALNGSSMMMDENSATSQSGSCLLN